MISFIEFLSNQKHKNITFVDCSYFDIPVYSDLNTIFESVKQYSRKRYFNYVFLFKANLVPIIRKMIPKFGRHIIAKDASLYENHYYSKHINLDTSWISSSLRLDSIKNRHDIIKKQLLSEHIFSDFFQFAIPETWSFTQKVNGFNQFRELLGYPLVQEQLIIDKLILDTKQKTQEIEFRERCFSENLFSIGQIVKLKQDPITEYLIEKIGPNFLVLSNQQTKAKTKAWFHNVIT